MSIMHDARWQAHTKSLWRSQDFLELGNFELPNQDGDFSEQRFRDIVNAYLANSVGNLLNRTLGLLRKNCAGALPASAADSAAPDHPLRAVAEAQVWGARLQYPCR